jgi:excisionase family DNA binding protein
MSEEAGMVQSTEDTVTPGGTAEAGERFDRITAAAMLEISLATLRRKIDDGSIGHVREGYRVYLTREHIEAYRNRGTEWVQPTLPGFEHLDGASAPFTDAQAAAAARLLEGLFSHRVA